jgi:2,4-dienoyl-CoA reductase-like NADH-dependent reductase (Old Yellow Enzyme family)
MNQALEAIHYKNISFKNRIVRSATVDPFGNLDGTVSEAQVKLYETLAGNNVGLIISGMSYITLGGKEGPGQNSISDDCFIESHKKLVDAVHQADSKVFLQICHCGSSSLSIDGMPPVAPSRVLSPGSKAMPRELTVPEIKEIVSQFIQAAVRAKAAGYDGIQIHCAHGYLLSEFINPVYNKRTDEYGGGIENRFRISEEVIRGIKKELGEAYPVWIKINSNIEENDEGYEKDLLYVAQKCKDLGVDAIEYSGYNFTPLGRQGLRNYYLERVAAIRRTVDIPAVLVGGIRSIKDMDEVLSAGIDMVSLSRPFICEPDLITKLMAGQEEAKCSSCSKCFTLYKKEGRRCIFHDL